MKTKGLIYLLVFMLVFTGCDLAEQSVNAVDVALIKAEQEKALAAQQETEAEAADTTPENTGIQDQEAEPEQNEPEQTEPQQSEPESEQETEQPMEPMEQLPQAKKLTLLVYMAADNDLESYALQNLKEMEHAAFTEMNILVLLDRTQDYDATNGDWTDTRLFEVVRDDTDSSFIVSKRLRCPNLSLSATVDTELDMANPNVLRNFISFAKSEYEAEKYALIIWGHGTGWKNEQTPLSLNTSRAVAIDDTSGTYMSVSNLGRALKNLGLCVIGFDTCFAGTFENIYEIRNCAEYSVASPGVAPSRGWNYRQLTEEISESDFTTKAIAGIMSECSFVQTTIFTNSRLNNVMESFEAFAENLAKTVIDRDSRDELFDSFNELIKNRKAYYYGQGKSDIYIDVYSLACSYSASRNAVLAEKAVRLKNELNRAGETSYSEEPCLGINYIPRTEYGTLAVRHSDGYIKDYDNSSQCSFIKESQWWVPTREGNSGSVLDKLFYTNFEE